MGKHSALPKDQHRSSTLRRRSGFGKRFFRVTTLATLMSNPGRWDLGNTVDRFVLQLRDLGCCDRFTHDGVTARTFLHHVPQPSRTPIQREPWPPTAALYGRMDLNRSQDLRSPGKTYVADVLAPTPSLNPGVSLLVRKVQRGTRFFQSGLSENCPRPPQLYALKSATPLHRGFSPVSFTVDSRQFRRAILHAGGRAIGA